MTTVKNKALKRAAIVLLVLVVLLAGGFYIYTLDYYRADGDVTAVIAQDDITITHQNGLTIFLPVPEEDLKTALIFYPGGKVENTAYAPMLTKLAREGLTCVLTEMPFNLAVFRINAADAVYGLLPDIEHWYISGHSLGGAMASSYVGKNTDLLDGLILLGAYPVNEAELPTLAVYGSEDIKLDTSKLAGVENIVDIMGGNHAYFGNYGEQKGDGTAAITREQQQDQTVLAIMDFIVASNQLK